MDREKLRDVLDRARSDALRAGVLTVLLTPAAVALALLALLMAMSYADLPVIDHRGFSHSYLLGVNLFLGFMLVVAFAAAARRDRPPFGRALAPLAVLALILGLSYGTELARTAPRGFWLAHVRLEEGAHAARGGRGLAAQHGLLELAQVQRRRARRDLQAQTHLEGQVVLAAAGVQLQLEAAALLDQEAIQGLVRPGSGLDHARLAAARADERQAAGRDVQALAQEPGQVLAPEAHRERFRGGREACEVRQTARRPGSTPPRAWSWASRSRPASTRSSWPTPPRGSGPAWR